MTESGDYTKPEKDRYIKLSQALEVLDSCACWWAHDRMECIPAADVRPRWIPVSERLIHSGWYLVACNEWGGSAVRKAIFDEATRKWLEFPCGGPKDITKFVTHWMPLPEPPKEG